MCFATEHRVGLGLSWAGGPAMATGVWILGHVLQLEDAAVADGTAGPDVAADVEIVRPLLTAQLDDSFVTIPSAQLAALERVLDDAQQYWSDNEYDHCDGDDGVLGRLAFAGYVTRVADCWN
jgi:hypothetical protein